jgi:hypothetical protein
MRSEFGMSAHEVFTGRRASETPEWEVALLAAETARRERERERAGG